MKKHLLLSLLIVAIATATYAHNNRTRATNLISKGIIKNPKLVPFKNLDNVSVVPLKRNLPKANATVHNATGTAKTAIITESVIGSTYYDLQTNASISNRLVRNADSTISATWTTSPSSPGTGADRGSGYNYWDGTAWIIPLPNMTGIDSIRTGFANIVVTASGHEMVISHTNITQSLNKSYRPSKGTGLWHNYTIGTPPNNDTWAKAIAGGANGESVHVLCQGTGTTGVPVNGQDGPLYYYRSLDSGVTFNSTPITFPDIDSSHSSGFGGDSYSIDANGNVIAFVVGDFTTNLYLLKSNDNGNTWTSTIVFQSALPQPWDDTQPYPDLNGDTFSDTVEVPSGDAHVMLDNNNTCHVWWSTVLCVNATGAGTGYFPNGIDGLYYWNETMPSNSGYIIAHSPELDGLPGLTIPTGSLGDGNGIGGYRGSLTQMPSSGIDAAGNLYVSYMSLCENCDTTIYGTAHKHTYVIKSVDGGVTWTNPDQALDIVQDANAINEEGVFACMAKRVDSDIYILFQRDEAPGHSLSTNATVVGWNSTASDQVVAKFAVTDVPTANCGAYFALYPTSTPHVWNAVNYASGAAPISYLWSWGDGTTSTGPTPSHTYVNAGFYRVCLSITDNNGCTSSMCDSNYFYRGNASSTMISINVIYPPTATNQITAADNSLTIYPNPAHTKLFVNGGAQQITITNLLGETILEKTFAADNTAKREVDISSFSQGIYFIKSGNETKKFVRN